MDLEAGGIRKINDEFEDTGNSDLPCPVPVEGCRVILHSAHKFKSL